MSVPWKYRKIGDFHRYYSGEKKAPVLTLVIGGNHEASSHFSELYYGGWLAPNIYYLGAANVVRYGPYRIAGISGIFQRGDYYKPHHERLPYDKSEIRSIYHVRDCDISKLLQIRTQVDIGLSHDWPRRVEWFGDYESLFASRPHFFQSATVDNLGSAPAERVMNRLRPKYWFSGHLHVKYTAVVQHKERLADDIFEHLAVPSEIRAQLPKSMFGAAPREKRDAPKTPPPDITNTVTNFLALDKPGPNTEFLELLEIDSSCNVGDTSKDAYMQKTPEGKFTLYYDEEWLSIILSADGPVTMEKLRSLGKGKSRADHSNTCLSWVQANITEKGLLKIPDNFERHAPIYDPTDKAAAKEQPREFPNSQTERFCAMLQIPHPFSAGGDVADDGFVVFE